MSASMEQVRLLHRLKLHNEACGTLEKYFCRFLAATCSDSSIQNLLVDRLHDLAPEVAMALPTLSKPARDIRRWHGLPLPTWPAGIREANRMAQARRWRVNTVLNWNMFGDAGPARLAQELGARSIYWERGAAWSRTQGPIDPGFADGYELYLADSQASRQMLLQRWDVRGDIRVCSPGVTHVPASLRRHAWALPTGRPLRIGFAASLQAFKGGVLAVHALKWLIRHGVDAELWVAGDGPDLIRMQLQTAHTGLGSRVRFLGRVRVMQGFYEDIDLLLHPALREPCGLSCAEALTAGLPVVATRVDCLPEVVDDGIDGYCVTPTLPLNRYSSFGGDERDIFPLVYRPELGLVAEPRLPNPDELGRAIGRIVSNGRRYAAFSAAAADSYGRKFSFDAHLRQLSARLRGEPEQEAAAFGWKGPAPKASMTSS